MFTLVIVVVFWFYFKPNFDYDKEEKKLFIHYWWNKERKVLIINFKNENI